MSTPPGDAEDGNLGGIKTKGRNEGSNAMLWMLAAVEPHRRGILDWRVANAVLGQVLTTFNFNEYKVLLFSVQKILIEIRIDLLQYAKNPTCSTTGSNVTHWAFKFPMISGI